MRIYTYSAAVMPTSQNKTLPDLTGFEVEAEDGKIGKIDEATYEADASCVVVDTGFWIFGKKRMIPAGVVQRVDRDEKRIFVNMTKDQIKNAPDYEDARHRADEKGYHKEVGEYYEPHVL